VDKWVSSIPIIAQKNFEGRPATNENPQQINFQFTSYTGSATETSSVNKNFYLLNSGSILFGVNYMF